MSYRVLAYHAVGRYDRPLPSGIGTAPEDFEDQLDHLIASGFQVVELSHIARALAEGRAPGPREVAITFDDGYADCLRYAVPELAKRALPATFFISAGLLGAKMEDNGLEMLARSNVTELSRVPGLTIAAHGHMHRSLPGLSPHALAAELTDSKHLLEDLSGRAVAWLSYPFGAYDPRVQDAARSAGYTDAFSVWTRDEGPFARLRIPLHTRDRTGPLFRFKLSRFYFPVKRLVKR